MYERVPPQRITLLTHIYYVPRFMAFRVSVNVTFGPNVRAEKGGKMYSSDKLEIRFLRSECRPPSDESKP
jgi:hypothetical protein